MAHRQYPLPRFAEYAADEHEAGTARVRRGADGSVRAAGPEDYTHIRFVLKNALTPGAVAFARYRTIVK